MECGLASAVHNRIQRVLWWRQLLAPSSRRLRTRAADHGHHPLRTFWNSSSDRFMFVFLLRKTDDDRRADETWTKPAGKLRPPRPRGPVARCVVARVV